MKKFEVIGRYRSMILSKYDGEDVTVVYRRYIKVQVDVRRLKNVRNLCHRV